MKHNYQKLRRLADRGALADVGTMKSVDRRQEGGSNGFHAKKWNRKRQIGFSS